MTKIAQNIRIQREIKGLSQEYMALKLGMSQNNYSKIELGKVKLNLEVAQKISQLLEIEITELIKLDDGNILNNTNQKGGNFANTIVQHYSDKMIESYENTIRHLKDEIIFLRDLIAQK